MRKPSPGLPIIASAGTRTSSKERRASGCGAISLFGSDDQRAWLDKTRAGKAISAFALSEPRSGSDVANMEMTATRDGGDYVLSGEKTWISNGGIADLYVVFARTGEAPGAKGISAFLVPADTPGLTVAERLEVIAPHPMRLGSGTGRARRAPCGPSRSRRAAVLQVPRRRRGRR